MGKTVDFITAINSGKRFHHSDCWDGKKWLTYNGDDSIVDQYGNIQSFSSALYIVGDFILEEKSITITETELDEVLCRMIENAPNNYGTTKRNADFIKEEFGFHS